MTGTNATSWISSTVAILKATTRDYNIVKDDNGLREAFHEAGRGLLLIEEALQNTETQLNGRGLVGDPKNAIKLLEACNTKANLSESIFKDVAQAPETSRFERYKAAVQQQGKGNTAEVLTWRMMEDVCNLAENHTTKEAMKDQIKGLRDAIDKLAKMEPSVPNEGSGNTFNSYGTGNQFNTLGGTQNNNTGNGYQFSGATFPGNVTFGNNQG